MGALSAEGLLVYDRLLLWYVNHGAVVTKVYRTIDYQPAKIFPWFVMQVTKARRRGDVDKSKALLAEVFKLLVNSAYFSDLDEIGQAYELESWKPRIMIRRPFQVGITVYQLAGKAADVGILLRLS